MITKPSTSIKRAFVTGATGIVGLPLCRELVSDGVRVTAYSRSASEFDFPDGVDVVSGDILDVSSMVSAAEGCDVIFHVAAAVHGSASDYAEFKEVNATGTENAIQTARANGAKLVHVSTVNVEAFQSGDLNDDYASTKARAEELVSEAVATELDAVIIRPATVFGNEQGKAGLLVDRLLAGTLKFLPAPSRKISPVWSGDLARALVGAARVGESGRVYTIAGPTLSTGDFVKKVCESGGFQKPYVSIPAWIFAVPLQVAWWLRKTTRWTPPVSVESLLSGSVHDGSESALTLNFEYSSIEQIFRSAAS
jgi:nucleoside-diphosphate-sugar epimerase